MAKKMATKTRCQFIVQGKDYLLHHSIKTLAAAQAVCKKTRCRWIDKVCLSKSKSKVRGGRCETIKACVYRQKKR